MPTQIDVPSAIGTLDGWGLWGSAASKVAAVASNDGDTSVIYAASGGALVQELFTFPSLVGVTDPVNSVTLSAVSREYQRGGGGRSFYFSYNSVRVGSNQESTVHAAAPSYSTVTYSAAGAELALSAVNGQHGLEFSAAGGPSNKAEFWVTHFFRTVDYSYSTGAAGDFAHLISGLVGALIGSNLLLREMPRLSRALGRIRLRPDEYEPAWRAWNAQKRLVLV